jgi:hypothetical protein
VRGQRRQLTKARKSRDVVVLQEFDRGEVRCRYQVTGCYSEAGCFELVVLTRVGRRWRQEVRERLDLGELERALAEPRTRPLASWTVYERARMLLRGGPRRTAERDHWGVVVLDRGDLGRGSRWQYRLRLDEERGPVFEWLLLRVDGAGVEWELVVRRWVPTQMVAYLVVQPPRGSLLDREAGLEALAQLRALGAWKLGPLSAEELATLLKEAHRLRALRPVISWGPLAKRPDPQKGHVVPDVAPRELELVRIGQGRARVLPCHRPFYDPLAWLLQEEPPQGGGEGGVGEESVGSSDVLKDKGGAKTHDN